MHVLPTLALLALVPSLSQALVLKRAPEGVQHGGTSCSFPLFKAFFCPNETGEVNVLTVYGLAKGSRPTAPGVMRFSVKYASASRWSRPVLQTTWQIPNNNPTALPPKCPQTSGVDPTSYSEDCLYLTLYVPRSLPVISGLPVLMWVHGGSFILGSSTDPGLDGSRLAEATQSIVALVQYRLGALGFLAPDSSNSNLGLRDLITALQFLRSIVQSFGGDKNKITVAGQSSGAYAVRALLGTPSAQSLFHKAILHSDPINFGFETATTFAALQTAFFSNVSCSLTNPTCLNDVPLPRILNAQDTIFRTAASIDPAAGSAQPIRIFMDGSLVTTSLTGNSFPPSINKPVMITTVQHEAGGPIYGPFPAPLPDVAFDGIVHQAFGPPRDTIILNSGKYHHSLATGGVGDGDDVRRALVQLFTDYLWRCPAWTLARRYTSGGRIWVGMFTAGATYPSQQSVPFCTSGPVCHQSEILIIFGTTPSPTPGQSALTAEMQARYSSFLRASDPNPSGSSLPYWPAATATDVHAIKLGGTGEVPVDACDPKFWGDSVPFDYQVYSQ